MFHVIRQLALRHDVSVLSYGTSEQARQLRQEVPQLKAVEFLRPPWNARYRRIGQLASTFKLHSSYQLNVATPQYQRAIDRLIADERIQVVHTEFSYVGPFRIPPGVRRILDTHNVEYDVFRRMWKTTEAPVRKAHYLLEYVKLKRDELSLCRSQDVLLATSDRDSELFARDVPHVPRFVVPNGVDTAYFVPKNDAPSEPHSLVFTGMIGYVPNADGITWFIDEILPLIAQRVPDVKLYVVGKRPPETVRARASERVVVTGTVPDVRPYVHRSSVYVVPLRMGGGTRLKIAEALSMKKPMVTTRVGCEGIDLVDGRDALFADTPREFADAVVRLLGDADLRARLADAGHDLAKRRYDWSVIGDQLEKVYRETLAPGL